VTNATTELDLAMAEDIITALDQLNVPGTRARLDWLTSLRTRLSKDYDIPGRTFSRFGTRRTRIIDPDANEDNQYVLTQAGVFPYATIRDRSVVQFSRLIDRTGKIQLVSPTGSRAGDFEALAPQIDRTFQNIPNEDPTVRRDSKTSFQEAIASTVDQLQRNRLENIAVLVPPNGLPGEIGSQIPVIRSKLPSDVDVRLDMVLVGPAPLPTEVRDLVAGSRGSVLTAADIDEIGAIAQRLKNEQTSGSWVVIPQQGRIPFDPGQTPHADPVGTLTTRATAVHEKLDSAHKDLSRIVDDLKKNRQVIDKSSRAAVDDALDSLALIRDSIGDPGVPGSLVAVANAIDQVTKDAQGMRQASALGESFKSLLTTLGVAREQLSKGRSLLAVAGTRTRSSAAARNALGFFATRLQADGGLQTVLDLGGYPDISLGEDLDDVEGVLRGFEKLLEASLVRARSYVPIYQRINRVEMEAQRRRLEDARRQREGGLANIVPLDKDRANDRAVWLSRFFAEGNAEFELIVGLSSELPSRPKADPTRRFQMKLVSDQGIEIADTAKVRFDEGTSTPSLLVFRVSTPPLRPGWYTPKLVFSKDYDDYEFLTRAEVNFTFSVGSARPNIQLITGLVQPPGSPNKWTLRRAEDYAVVEVQVSAPNSVLAAQILGYYQMITQGADPIDTRSVDFRDDGTDAKGLTKGQAGFDETRCDRAANDGIYTAFIPLTDVTVRTEFRVFVQAETTDGQARYIALDNPQRDDDDKDTNPRQPSDKKARLRQDEATKAAEGGVLKFQRATTVHFQVEP
jgi:hypothetical protein